MRASASRRNGARHRGGRRDDRTVPGFPTDLQAQFMGLMTMAKGKSHITETISKPLHACAGTGAAGAHITLSARRRS